MKRLHDDVTTSSEGCGETETNFCCGDTGRFLMSSNLMLQNQIFYLFIPRHSLFLSLLVYFIKSVDLVTQ